MTTSVNPLAIDIVLAEVRGELLEAMRRFPGFHSPHEGWAVIYEELDELWDHVRANEGREADARYEAIQVAAMAVRYVIDCKRETS